MQLPDRNTLISLAEIVQIVKSPSPLAYKKRYLLKAHSNHPRPVQERPMLFMRDEWEQWFGSTFKSL